MVEGRRNLISAVLTSPPTTTSFAFKAIIRSGAGTAKPESRHRYRPVAWFPFAASDVPGRQDETAVSLTWFELNAVSLHPSPYGGNKRNCPSEGSLAATCGRPFCNSYQADNQLGRSAGGGGFTSFGVSDFFSLRSSIRTPLVESNVLGRSLAPVQMTSVSPSSL